MRSTAAILFLLAVVLGVASALGIEKPPLVTGTASALGFKKPSAVAGAASALPVKKPPTVAVVMPADPRGLMLGRFAALVYSLSRNIRLTCTGVSGVEQHPDESGRGVTYQMVLAATDARGGTYKYSVVVWGVPKTEHWMLLQFKRVN